MNVPCKTGMYEIPVALLEAYSAIYPTADLEFAKMVIWLESHRSRRPATPKSAPRFIANWFRNVPKRVAGKQSVELILDGLPDAVVYDDRQSARLSGGTVRLPAPRRDQ